MELTYLTEKEMQEIEGGFLPLLIIGAVILLSKCSGGQNSTNSGSGVQVNVQCSNCTVTSIINGDTTRVQVIKK